MFDYVQILAFFVAPNFCASLAQPLKGISITLLILRPVEIISDVDIKSNKVLSNEILYKQESVQKDSVAEVYAINEVHPLTRQISLVAGFEVGYLVINRDARIYIRTIGSTLEVLK